MMVKILKTIILDGSVLKLVLFLNITTQMITDSCNQFISKGCPLSLHIMSRTEDIFPNKFFTSFFIAFSFIKSLFQTIQVRTNPFLIFAGKTIDNAHCFFIVGKNICHCLLPFKNSIQKNVGKFQRFFWCDRKESNFHGSPHSDLNAARLPIPPRPRQIIRKFPYTKKTTK